MEKTYWSFRINAKKETLFVVTFSNDEFFPFKRVCEFISEYRDRPLFSTITEKNKIASPKIRIWHLNPAPHSVTDIIQISKEGFEYFKQKLHETLVDLVEE